MRFPKYAIAVALLAVAPVIAHADDASTSVPALATPAAAPAAMMLSDAQQSHMLALIVKRKPKLDATPHSGAVVVDVDGTPLWRNRAYMPMMPASTMKVVTATVALALMGPDWKPVTTVRFHDGTLTLVGGGDAMLNSDQLSKLAALTKQALAANGDSADRLVIDDSLFPNPTLQAGVSTAQWRSEERPVRALVVDRKLTFDSSLDAGKAFRTLLAKRGVMVAFAGRGKGDGDVIASIEGVRLQSSLRTMLWYSDNDIAEMTFRLSAIAAGRSGSWGDARKTAYETLAKLGISTKNSVLIDGSGLSRKNRATAYFLAETLNTAARTEKSALLESLLPTAGLQGTLIGRFDTVPAKCMYGKLNAKTGGLHDVISLAGYAPQADGVSRAFAMIVNGTTGISSRNNARSAIDGMAAAFSGC